jgi:hypothetical protein
METKVVEPSPAAYGQHTPRHRRRRAQQVALLISTILLMYYLIAYVAMPFYWKTYVWRHPSLDDVPRITFTSSGIPGDPLNVELIGTESEVRSIMNAAGWYAAAHLGLRSDLRIAADTILRRPYKEAPVSRLYLFGRKEDLAFEKPVGNSPVRRNHVRLWKTEKIDSDGRPVWVGSASYDERVGLSRTTGQITHHISPDVDEERDLLFLDLSATRMLSENYFVDDFHVVCEGRNGGGDPWFTDGRLEVGVIKAHVATATQREPSSQR